jgi:preprotein translocase subunit YajC
MPKELLGKRVLMSNGMAGVVKHINDRNVEYPIVEVNGEVIITDRNLYCVSMIIDG